jgi:RimJ/RimL family protein N-acetyltransferase
MVPITTERLVLRPFTPDDVDDVYAYDGLADVARYLYRPPRTRERCAELIAASSARWEQDGDSVRLAVCRRDTPGVLGDISLRLASARARQAEIGWVLHPTHSGHGYATEAARAVAARAFGELGVHRLFARVDVENAGSVRLCERLGMRREAHLIENDLDPNAPGGERWGSEYVYAALAADLRPT